MSASTLASLRGPAGLGLVMRARRASVEISPRSTAVKIFSSCILLDGLPASARLKLNASTRGSFGRKAYISRPQAAPPFAPVAFRDRRASFRHGDASCDVVSETTPTRSSARIAVLCALSKSNAKANTQGYDEVFGSSSCTQPRAWAECRSGLGTDAAGDTRPGAASGRCRSAGRARTSSRSGARASRACGRARADPGSRSAP